MGEPTMSRPESPDFLANGTGELLPWSWARERLAAERNYWVVTTTSRGRPHARPVWGVLVDDVVYLSVGAAGFQRGDAQRPVSVHVDSARDVVIVDGVAERIDDPEVRREIGALYNPKYEMDSDADWVNFRVIPRVAWGWRDEDINTATKWTF